VENVSRMSPTDFLFIIVMAAGVMITQMLWGWREPIADFVKRFRANRAGDYVTHDNAGATKQSNFPTSRPEVEVEATRKLQPGNDDGMVVLTQKALQSQLNDAVEDGMIRAYAALSKGDYLVPGKATEIKKAFFGAGGGRALQRLNAAIQAVDLPPAESEPPRVTPLAQRPLPRGQRFAGELADELAQE
jgi:hypothetical protein